MTITEEKIDDSHDHNHNHIMTAEEQLQLLLQEAGLESVAVDPSSMEALKAFVSTPDYTTALTSTTTMDKSMADPIAISNTTTTQEAPPISEVAPHNHPALQHFPSGLTANSAADYSWDEASNNNNAAAAEDNDSTAAHKAPFHKVEGATLVENHILEQLHRQTQIMLDMQRRMDELTATVEFMAGGTTTTGVFVQQRQQNNNTNRNERINERDDKIKAAKAEIAARGRDLVGAAGQRQQQQAQQAPADAAAVPIAARPLPRAAANNNNNGGFFQSIQNSRVYQIMVAFGKLRRRYGVQPLDGGLIFKVLFMMAILSTRMTPPRSHKNADTKSGGFGNIGVHLKFFVLALIVVVGFLVQTGYLQYSYIFFVKENIAGRIWAGESVQDVLGEGRRVAANGNNNGDNPAAVPRGQHPPGRPQQQLQRPGANNNNNENVAVGGWRNTFLGGIIPQGDQGGIVGVLQDICLIFGSFLLSIFPMWQPEGPPREQRDPPQPIQPPQHQEQPPLPAAGGVAAGPGDVRPPRDAFQAADDSDDDED